jgi:hypothetical protein
MAQPTRHLTEDVLFKSSKDMKREIAEVADRENISNAEVIRRAVTEWLLKDKNDLLNHSK